MEVPDKIVAQALSSDGHVRITQGEGFRSGSGCGQTDKPVTIRPGDEIQYVAKALDNSPTYAELKRRVPIAGFILDSENHRYYVVDVGEDLSEHFMRSTTLRVYKDGAISKLVLDNSFEESWEFEYRPQAR